MCIDTVRAGTSISLQNISHFEKEISTFDIIKKTTKSKFVTLGKEGDEKEEKTVPRLTYYKMAEEGAEGYLNFECSLPKFLLGQNYSLLTDVQLEESLVNVAVWIQDKLHIKIPGWSMWNVSRLDGCHAWQVGEDMQFYFQALRDCPVPGYKRVPYESDGRVTEGFSWVAKTVRTNTYDKGGESGVPEAAGCLRMEVQELNKSSCAALADRIGTGHSVDDLIQADIGRALVRTWLKRIGMQEKIWTKADIYEKLCVKYGADDAASRLFFIEGYKRFGSQLKTKSWYSERTYKRRLVEAKAAGWLVDSTKELEGLKV